jgi:hypothetical protein
VKIEPMPLKLKVVVGLLGLSLLANVVRAFTESGYYLVQAAFLPS